MTWGNVKTWVKANLGKQGDTSIDALLPLWAEAFQLRVERDRNYHFLKTTSQRTISSAEQSYALPSDYKDDLLVYLYKTSPKGFVELIPISDVDVIRLYVPTVDATDKEEPRNYVISNGTITFWPWPDADYVVRLVGWRNTAPPVLSSAESYTNAWMLKYPDLYVQELTAIGFEESQELEDAAYFRALTVQTLKDLRADWVTRELPGQIVIAPRADVYGTTQSGRSSLWFEIGGYL